MSCSFNGLVFKNASCSAINCKRIDLFIACIGYEDRSYYIYQKIKGKLSPENSLLFAVNDFDKYPVAKKIINDALKNGIEVCVVDYSDSDKVKKKISDRIRVILENYKKAIKIHIDYSAMPRSWYCSLPSLLKTVIPKNSEVFFWYSEGVYDNPARDYPTVGIDSWMLFSGRPSMRVDRKRLHFIGVGYDAIRTRGIIALLDPESFVICEANNPLRKDISENLQIVNKELLDQSDMLLLLDITNIEYMIVKFYSLVRELFQFANSDIIIVPDGPKPLIFIMSLIPWLYDRAGVCCLHMIRNNGVFSPHNVKPLGNNYSSTFSKDDHIIGFSIII